MYAGGAGGAVAQGLAGGRRPADRGQGRLAGAQCAGRPAGIQPTRRPPRATGSTSGSTTSSKGWACCPTIPSAANAGPCARATSWSISPAATSCSTPPPDRTRASMWSAPNMRRSPPNRPRWKTFRAKSPTASSRRRAAAARRHDAGAVKATQKDFAALARARRATATVFFFCGPDEAGAQRCGRTHRRAARRSRRTGRAVRRRAASAIRCGWATRRAPPRCSAARAISSSAPRAMKSTMRSKCCWRADGRWCEPCPVLIVATGATDKSRTAKLLDGRAAMRWSAMFHPPDLRADQRRPCATWPMLRGSAFGGDSGRAHRPRRGLDTRLAQSEVNQAGALSRRQPAKPAHRRCGGARCHRRATEDDGFAPLVNAVLGGETGRSRANCAGCASSGSIRSACCSRSSGGRRSWRSSPRKAAAAQRLPTLIDARRRRAAHLLEGQARHRRPAQPLARRARLERLVERLAALHAALLANSQHAELLLAQELADIARAAARRG